MLRRIIFIRNVGRFRNSVAQPNPELARNTFVFGANGYGKSTLCAILRSLQGGDPSSIIGRQTLGVAAAPEIDLLFENGNRRFREGAWSATQPTISIFDGEFIAENVHSGDVVDIAQKRNLYRVIVGRAGVGLAEQEKEIAELARAKQGELTAAERAVRGLMPPGLRLIDFVALARDPEVDPKIEAQNAHLDALRQAESIHARALLSPLPEALVPAELRMVLGKSLDGVGEDVEIRIAEHLDHQRMQERGQQWLAEGVTYAGNDECPFCGRDGIAALPLVQAYRALFSEAYRQLQVDVQTVEQQLAAAFGGGARQQLQTIVAQNDALIEFWSRYCEVNRATFPAIINAVALLQRAFDQLSGVLNRKAQALLEAIVDDAEVVTAGRLITEANASISAYNEIVRTTNGLIAEKKRVTAAGDLGGAQTELRRLQATKRRHEDAVVAACDAYLRFDAEKTALENQKAVVREQLERHTQNVVQPYEARINYFLDRFNARFRIVRTGHGYPGGVATSTYQLSINDIAVELGDGRTPPNRPSFKNTLSAGDRTTLALAFFLAGLEREPDLAERTVVFDDPFNSQDAFRRRQTLYEIMQTAGRCAQVVVLSHDHLFLKQLWEKCPPAARAAVQISYHPETGSKIRPINLEDACRGRAQAELDDLMAFRASGAGNPREIIKKLRVVLETYFRTTYPGSFDAADSCGGILQKIRAAGAQHPAHDHYDTLNRINDYTAEYHHGEDPGAAAEPPLDETELMGFVADTLKMVNAVPA